VTLACIFPFGFTEYLAVYSGILQLLLLSLLLLLLIDRITEKSWHSMVDDSDNPIALEWL